MARKRKFDDGGVIEGPNANIDDDTRSRAMAWLKRQQEGASESVAEEPKVEKRPERMRPTAPPKEVTRVASKAAPKATPKAAPKSTRSSLPTFTMPAASSTPSFGPARNAVEMYESMTPDVSAHANKLRREFGYKKGGKIGSASKRGDGIAQRGKTRGKMV